MLQTERRVLKIHPDTPSYTTTTVNRLQCTVTGEASRLHRVEAGSGRICRCGPWYTTGRTAFTYLGLVRFQKTAYRSDTTLEAGSWPYTHIPMMRTRKRIISTCGMFEVNRFQFLLVQVYRLWVDVVVKREEERWWEVTYSRTTGDPSFFFIIKLNYLLLEHRFFLCSSTRALHSVCSLTVHLHLLWNS